MAVDFASHFLSLASPSTAFAAGGPPSGFVHGVCYCGLRAQWQAVSGE